MRLESLSKTIVLHDLIDVFQILDEATVSEITVRLEDIYGYDDVIKLKPFLGFYEMKNGLCSCI